MGSQEEENDMKICSFNVNSIRARKDLILSWLEHRNNDIDILCFQELKTIDEGFPYEDFTKLGYQCLVYGQKAYNGVAICTKIKPDSFSKGFGIKKWDEQKRIISAKIKGLHLINIYAPRGGLQGEDKFNYKQEWYKNFIEFLNAQYSPKDPIVILGDYNVAFEDIDVYSLDEMEGSISFLPEERAAFNRLRNWSLIDAFRYLHPDKIQFTWWDYIGGAIWRDQGLRIDYILCTEKLLKKLKTIDVDLWPRKRRKPTPSDHAPLIAEFDISEDK